MNSRVRATYRVQLTPDFGFEEAAAISGYLAELGVSHLYCSPYLQAAPGSTHGYDVVDPSSVNVELGGAAGHRRLCAALAAAGLGQVLDIVPNHMAIAGRMNRWFWDVLENGPSSRFAGYFDVSWDPPQEKLKDVVLMPVLGDHYGRVLEAGQIRLSRQGAQLTVHYFEHEFPVDPRSYGAVLGDALGGIGAEFAALPVTGPLDAEGAERRSRAVAGLMGRLEALDTGELDAAVARINSDVEQLDALLQLQNYRLARWQTAGYELDYRRFFDINTLAAIRVEDDRVFDETHRLILEWAGEGLLDGVRVDHPDGLRDPAGYLERLRDKVGESAWIVVEKILQSDERLNPDWPVDGTTGYEFMNRALGLFIDAEGEEPLTEAYVRFAGEIADYHDLVHEKKHMVMRELFGADLNRLVALFVRVCEGNRRYRDYTRRELLDCLRETIACLPVYRTYARPGDPRSVSAQDRRYVTLAIEQARERRPDLDPELYDLLGRLLLLEVEGEHESEMVSRFQQTSGPVTAKGVEDTVFYVYNRLTALNEVGGDPSVFGTAPAEFHAACQEVAAGRPSTMLATSTHDTKRSEDVRARLALLSEVPSEWLEAVRRWGVMNEPHRSGSMPDRNAEYLLYQALVGAHPLPVERALRYMEKAAREAKTHTSWIAPSAEYEGALRAFIEGALADPRFTGDLAAFAEPLIDPGRVNSLALKLLALTAPGVPDLYQGSELWDLSLVDPDNRRPVDYALRRRLLGELAHMGAAEAWRRRDEGLPKLLVVQRALELRSRRPEAFAAGYEPLAVRGSGGGHALGFIRGGSVATVVPRLMIPSGGAFGELAVVLPGGRWVNVLTGAAVAGGEVSVGELLEDFPVALLESL